MAIEQEVYIPLKKYKLDDLEDNKLIINHFKNAPDFRVLEMGDRFFIQFKQLAPPKNKTELDNLDEILHYAKLTDEYYSDNNEGFGTLEAAQKSLSDYLNAPAKAKIHPINLITTNE